MGNTLPMFKAAPVKGGYHEEDKWVWCGCAVEEPGVGYHLYSSRWRHDYPFLQGYVFLSEIVHAFSPTLEGPYHFVEKVLPASPRGSWDSRMAHNPTVIKFKDEYILYYIATTYEGEPPTADDLRANPSLVDVPYSNIRIGVARSKSPAGPWTVCPHPALEARPGKFDASLVTNPAPTVGPDGKIYLYYRTNTPKGLRIGLAVASDPEGPYERLDDPVMPDANVEDPFTWHDGKRFNMIAKDMKGTLTGEYHAGAHFVSDNGRDWTYFGKGYSRQVTFDDGRTVVMGSFERPQLLFGADGRPKALFAATADGPGGFRNAEHTWNQVIPFED